MTEPAETPDPTDARASAPEADAAADDRSLADVLAEFDYSFPQEQIEQLDAYRRVLWEWNEKMNLTRHTTLEKFVTRDVGDSWELANLLEKGERVLDVGSGGGVPGVILAIIRPDLDVSLCESVAKKAQALEDIVQTLGLDAKVFGARAEDLLEVTTFDTLVVRAVAPMRKLLFWLAPRWDAFDRLLLIKGRNWVAERGEARHYSLLNKLELRKVAEYVTRGADAVSVILKIEPKEQD
ncbi:Ribosomal RNA small subunit methyltransferase G [Posidoniimonas polymericola]|uniref:Ribosomal RNA small subunit methyltransferase G n=1 Tax=Posidoniimonas polymericola TaxID=2528002 RepID=A0A5C5YFR4_9BACT|nr:16S rRNA (guanine(527)-N(7))-methyltransferase RsmG [Posidoniimonas polymericola]TWT74556.1 Ribosomal RNA small subunit methyltransferase G [Posidoniimonas polymericola]